MNKAADHQSFLRGRMTEVLARHSSASWKVAAIEACTHDKSASVRRVADEVHDSLVGPQGAPTPVDRDEREQSMLDLVPLARPRREVADVDREVELVREALKLKLPDVRPIAVAATRVGCDEDLAGPR